MTTTDFHAIVTSSGCRNTREFSRLMLGNYWTRGLYQSLLRQLETGQLSGWVAALAETTAELHGMYETR